jgi:hypothetical protein
LKRKIARFSTIDFMPPKVLQIMGSSVDNGLAQHFCRNSVVFGGKLLSAVPQRGTFVEVSVSSVVARRLSFDANVELEYMYQNHLSADHHNASRNSPDQPPNCTALAAAQMWVWFHYNERIDVYNVAENG